MLTTKAALRLAALPLLPVAVLPLTGCGAGGSAIGSADAGLQPADHGRPAPRAQGSYRLWPERPPAPPQPGRGGAPMAPSPVPGVAVPAGGLRGVPPRDVLAADPAAPAACGEHAPEAAACPVREAYYRDLTGNGHEELVLGIDQPDGSLTIRVYTHEDGRVLRIMNDTQRITGAEVTERDLILRSATSTPGTESREVWSWCAHLGVLAPRLTEIIRHPAEPRR
uniref:Lipoprotein n=1 Tax=Streptomyces sp. NBC_00049 TaxID=2903617 RepID=A0AAU2JSA5_9ACTN